PNRRPGVRHSTFESLRLGRSSQSIASGFLRFWDSLNFKKDREFVGITVLFLDKNVNSVIHGFTPVGGANHYMTSLKEDSIVKVDRFTVARCSSMYKITDHPFLIRFISLTIIDKFITYAPEINLQSRLDYVVEKIRYVQGSDLTKEITRVVIVSSLICKKQSTHNSLYITVYIVLTSIIKNI
uniref:Replication protein A 70 kDa DNA-binding subunit B/D first OB fold domain-containing protein n=1 Tax=Brassica oleracea var. oleracea TaxID=109376 RepID=A0A0D3A9M2_BRAOL